MEGNRRMGDTATNQSRFSVDSSKAAGHLSESESIGIRGTIAEGRTCQSEAKNRVLLAYAWRIVDGLAKPHETAFMTALLAADIPETPSTADALTPAVPIFGSSGDTRGGE